MNIFSLSVTDVARSVQLGQRSRDSDGLTLSPHRHVLLFPPSQRATRKQEHAPWEFVRTGFRNARWRREGCISPEDVGLWMDSQMVDFAHTQTIKVGVQLEHAGCKAPALAP